VPKIKIGEEHAPFPYLSRSINHPEEAKRS